MENITDVTQIIINTINTIFENLFASIDNNLYSVLDDITFISSDILTDKNFEKIFGTSTSNGILLIANSLLFGFLLYYSIQKNLRDAHLYILEISSFLAISVTVVKQISVICLRCLIRSNNPLLGAV